MIGAGMAFASAVRPYPVMPPLPVWNSPTRPVQFSPMKIDSPEVPPSPSSPVGSETHEEATPTTPGERVSSTSPNLLRKKRTRRKPCGGCRGCLRQEDCGQCSVCTNPNNTNSKCKQRRCETLKRRPSVMVCSYHWCSH